jgi:hypothetical protein
VAAVAVFASLAGSVEAQTLAEASALARKGVPVDPALRVDIERLMQLTGASANAAQMASAMMDAILNGFKQTQQSVPPRVIDVVREVLTREFEQAFNGPEMKDKQIALYAKYYTHEDVKGMIAFYQTELGKKTIVVMPNIAREGMAIGQQWAQANMPRVLEGLAARLKSEGLLPANSASLSR